MKKITMNQFKKVESIGVDAIKDIPASRNRIRFETENTVMIKAIKSIAGRDVQLDKIKNKTIICVDSVNLGTKKWSQMCDELTSIEFATFIRETNNFYVLSNKYQGEFKIAKHRVIAVI